MEGNRKLVRTDDRLVGGVCGGIARFFDLDPTMVRVAYALLTIFTAFSGVIVYLVMWMLVPEESRL
jgi:phage shock protein C